MRSLRIKFNGAGYYHIVSRIVNKAFWIDEIEAAIFISIMRKVEAFTGVRVLDFVVMSNHFHLLVFASGVCLADEEELIRRCRCLYTREEVDEMCKRWEDWKAAGRLDELRKEQDALRRRMEDISPFMKMLKQRFSMSYNGRHDHVGNVWEGRFRSVLVDPKALPLVSAYIDLNPVRAKIYGTPERCISCGYGEAVAGNELARQRLYEVYGETPETIGWEDLARRHRMLLYGTGGRYGKHPPCFDAELVEKVLAEGGRLSLFELLRCKIRYLTHGFAFGSREFVEARFRENPKSFGPRRKTGARRLLGYSGEMGELFAARDLRKDVIVPMRA